MAKQVVPYPEKGDDKRVQVEDMFDSISSKYDFLNRFLSLGIDQSWRKKAISVLSANKPKTILDVATGTCDLALMAFKKLNPEHITGTDISAGMLRHGQIKIDQLQLGNKIDLVQAEAENLPFSDGKFDAAMVAFGVRNFADLHKGLKEINRVMAAGGRFVVLEFSYPRNPIMRSLYKFYNKYVVSSFGRLISGDDSAYKYLPESVKAFPEGEAFLNELSSAGFSDVKSIRLSFGICSVYYGDKR